MNKEEIEIANTMLKRIKDAPKTELLEAIEVYHRFLRAVYDRANLNALHPMEDDE